MKISCTLLRYIYEKYGKRVHKRSRTDLFRIFDELLLKKNKNNKIEKKQNHKCGRKDISIVIYSPASP